MTPTQLLIGICTVTGLVLVLALAVLAFDRWARREHDRQVTRIVHRITWRELTR